MPGDAAPWQSGTPVGQVLHEAPRLNQGREQPGADIPTTANNASNHTFFITHLFVTTGTFPLLGGVDESSPWGLSNPVISSTRNYCPHCVFCKLNVMLFVDIDVAKKFSARSQIVSYVSIGSGNGSGSPL